MNPRSMAFAGALFVLVASGCSSLERSRDLADPRVPGKTLALQVCSTCHGDDGNSVSPQFPKLAGQRKEYLVAQLKGFRGHGRSDPPGPEYMWGISRSLTDEQIDAIADYFAAQATAPHAGGSDAASVAPGRKIFESGIPETSTPACQACHGAHAQGEGAFPRLAAQHAPYLVRQLHVFQGTDFRPNTPMKAVTHALTTRQMLDVAAYAESLSPDR